MSAPGAVLLTGATGFVGMEVMARYLERSDRQVYALVRAADDAEAAGRMETTMAALYGDAKAHPDRVTAVAADIERDGLGLPPERRAQLAERVSDIVHCAASVSFSLPLDESRQVNVVGTRRLLDFAREAERHGGLTRFGYVSTAYVAGTHEGEFREDQLDVGQGFRNAYERSKFEAESLVRQEAARLPVQIFRPSIVVGERGSGWTASFNVLYAPLKAFARGALRVLPARRSAPVDVVPVDYVADAIYALASGPVEGHAETFQLVAGREATTVGRLASLGARHFGRRPPRVVSPRVYRRLLHPLLIRGLPKRKRRALARSEVFFPYFTMRVTFDDRRARARLERQGIRVSSVERYLGRLIDFARAADWGRRSLGRYQVPPWQPPPSPPEPAVQVRVATPVESRAIE
jgi:thioester reductase-like protein